MTSSKRARALTYVSCGALHDQVRDLVVPSHYSNKGCVGVVLRDKPPWLLDTSTAQRLDVPFTTPAVGMDFRPVDKTEINGERNQEVAIVYGTNGTNVDRYDVALDMWLEPIPFPRATSVAYSHQGDRIALGSGSGYVSVIDLKGGNRRKELFTIAVAKSAVVRLAFSGQGETLVLLTASGAIYFVEVSTGVIKQRSFAGGFEDVDFDCWAHVLHNSARLAAFAGSANRASGHCRVWLYDLDQFSTTSIPTRHTRYVRRLQFIGENQLIAIGDQGAELLDLVSRKASPVSESGESLKVAYSALQAGPFTFVMGTAATGKVAV